MWLPFFWPVMAFVVGTFVGLVLRALLLSLLRRWSTPPNGLAAFAGAIRVPSLLWCVVLGLWLAVSVANLPQRLTHPVGLLLQAAVIMSMTFTVAGVLSSVVSHASERQALGGAVTGLARTTTRFAVLLIGFLVMLSALGLEITPMLTALGVGGLAVALALQDTLSNLFAGIHLLADKPVRIGDYVKIADGPEGRVIDIGWRSTRLKTLANNTVVLPNKKMAESIITNYELPAAFTGVSVKVSVDYDADPDYVRAVLLEELTRAVAEVPGMVAEPPPTVLLIPGFGDASLDFTGTCTVAAFPDQALVQHELRMRIVRRFHAEGIRFPVQVRTVELRGGPRDGDGAAGSREARTLADEGQHG